MSDEDSESEQETTDFKPVESDEDATDENEEN
jgi:hypothetical protein